MASDIDNKFDDGFPAHKAGDLTDLSSLPGEMRAFRAEMRSAFEFLSAQFLPFMTQAREDIADLRERVAALESHSRRRAKR